MSKLKEEEIAKRFAKYKPADFDNVFYDELNSILTEAFIQNKNDKAVTLNNKDNIVIAIAYIYICYGMFELKSAICTMLMPHVINKLISYEDVENALFVLELQQGIKK